MSPYKKSKSKIIKMIVDSISSTPKSIYELSKEMNSNWDTIKGNVELLRELKIVKISDQKVFMKPDCSISVHEDTVAGLPLSHEIRRRIYALAKKICDKWVELKRVLPNNTQLHKAMIEIAEKFPSLNIPRGWYFYGKIVLVKVDKSKFSDKLDKYDFKKLSIDMKKLKKEIEKVIEEISNMSNHELMDYQYSKYRKKDYIIKREIEKLFLLTKFDKEEFANLLYKLIFNFKVNPNDELNHKMISIIKESISIMISQTFKKEIDKDVSFKIQLMETFSTFWKLYATYGLLESMEGELGYDKRIVKSVFEDRINFYSNDLTDHFINLAVT